jgi:hypothetical protein
MINKTYRLDNNHLGVRVAVLIAMLAGFVGGLVGIPALIHLLGLQGSYWSLLTLAGALGLAFLLSWLAEVGLPRVWPSGRVMQVDGNGVSIRGGGLSPVDITWDKPIDIWSWCFAVNDRRAWIPRGWYCVALRLLQDGQVISPYTFLKPGDAQALPYRNSFEELISQKYASKPGQEHLAQFVAEQDHLRAAEAQRWDDGVEMRPADFSDLLGVLDGREDNWPPEKKAD